MEKTPCELHIEIPDVHSSEQVMFLACHSSENAELKSIGDKIKYARLTARLNTYEVSQRAGIDTTTLCRYERDRVTEEHIDYNILIRIAEACGVDRFCFFDEYQTFRYHSAEIVRSYIKENKLTSEKLAHQLNVSISAVKRWRRGECSPSHKHWESVFRDYFINQYPSS